MSLEDTEIIALPLDSLLPAAVPRSAGAVAKRALDVVGAALLLILAAPVLLAVMFLIRLADRGPAIFVQPRIGWRCRPFPMLKLRTMRVGSERLEERLAAAGEGTFLKLADDPRVTRLGGFLRRSSLDELPQLVNVLRGEMSLVGPRPLLVCDLARFPKRDQMRRFSVPPGLTGLWQVSGRSATSDEERIRLDLEYVDRWSLWLDLKILARTLPAILAGEGAG